MIAFKIDQDIPLRFNAAETDWNLGLVFNCSCSAIATVFLIFFIAYLVSNFKGENIMSKRTHKGHEGHKRGLPLRNIIYGSIYVGIDCQHDFSDFYQCSATKAKPIVDDFFNFWTAITYFGPSMTNDYLLSLTNFCLPFTPKYLLHPKSFP